MYINWRFVLPRKFLVTRKLLFNNNFFYSHNDGNISHKDTTSYNHTHIFVFLVINADDTSSRSLVKAEQSEEDGDGCPQGLESALATR